MWGKVTIYVWYWYGAFLRVISMTLTEATLHYSDVIMGTIASQNTNLTIVYSTVYSADQRKHQSSASLAFVRAIHRGPVNSPHKWPVTRKVFPFDDVIMDLSCHDFAHNIYCDNLANGTQGQYLMRGPHYKVKVRDQRGDQGSNVVFWK